MDPFPQTFANPAVCETDGKGSLGLTLLHSPQESEVDLIFVHGLGGNSKKTWTKDSLLSHFWPQDWLPRDSAFAKVRIHTYGYESPTLRGRRNILDIHDFGNQLLANISSSPYIAHSSTRIVIVAHSMGGLVSKKAFIMANQDPMLRDLAGRFAAMYFLATPHRGSALANPLNRFLKMSSERAYVGDLESTSQELRTINDQFRHYTTNLKLFSFYETLNSSYLGGLIVDSESAVLGYPGETQIRINADHRSICKFESPRDPNYILLRNALALTMVELTS